MSNKPAALAHVHEIIVSVERVLEMCAEALDDAGAEATGDRVRDLQDKIGVARAEWAQDNNIIPRDTKH